MYVGGRGYPAIQPPAALDPRLLSVFQGLVCPYDHSLNLNALRGMDIGLRLAYGLAPRDFHGPRTKRTSGSRLDDRKATARMKTDQAKGKRRAR